MLTSVSNFTLQSFNFSMFTEEDGTILNNEASLITSFRKEEEDISV